VCPVSVPSTHRVPSPSPSAGDGGSLQAIADELHRHGWDARVVRRTVVGELDVRLRVTRAGTPAAELLDAWENRPCGDRWQAVRIAPHSRVVWCGPTRPCPLPELVSFVEDLLRLDPSELSGRWTALG
jgi:hypothetical protein